MRLQRASEIQFGPAFLLRVALLAAVATALLTPASAAPTISDSRNPVSVEIFEGIEEAHWLEPTGQEPISAYSEAAFGFVRIPARFSRNALPLDRSAPFTLKATISKTFPAGKYRFRLRGSVRD